MSPDEWAVLAGGASLIAAVNWYFFGERRATQAAVVDGVQEQKVVVEGGYSPAVVRVRSGRPVRLLFDRRETSGCSEEVVVPEYGIRRYLPSGSVTPVDFVPKGPGEVEFTCGMGMLRGKVVVE